ncbi:hypothetical protein CJ301_00415 [Limimaricola cinnabarinus]|uniref:Tyr recombinase domain-containing protein n=2 Tax=Limimaricola cinnabarinus TaxID=1125964 RepID=A0A2G1MJR6_9RHOB|nr:hypothetical protein CJ301_00415 [Limimaricola cinnabarinus]
MTRSKLVAETQEENSGNQTLFGGIPLCLSLKTHGFSVAAELARRLSTLSDQIFLYATATMNLSPQDVTRLLTALARFEIEAADRERALADPRSPQLAQAALEREAARQAVLRQAFFQQDYTVVEEPLRHVAAHLGIELPEAGSEQARLLAYEATRVLLDASEEKARRDRGIFPSPSPYFVRAIAEETSPGIPAQSTASAIAERLIDKEVATKLFPPSRFASCEPAHEKSGPEETPTEKPAVRDLLKKRGVLQSCPPELLASLESGEPITFDRAADFYLKLKEAGFADEWHKYQRPDAAVGRKWVKSSGASAKTSLKIWAEPLGSKVFTEIPEEEIEAAINVIRSLPRLHGKGKKYTAESYPALIAKVEAREAQAMDNAERELRRQGCNNEAEIRDARLAHAEPRLRAETYMRIVRMANRVGTMLEQLGLVGTNPFSICTFSNREAKALKMTEENVARQPWDDRLNELFATRVFKGNAADEADPLFWMPLIGYLMGTRMEEAAQAGPDDVQSDEGIAYLIVRQALGDSVKSENATRKIPVHPALIDLGFMELVERARKRGDRRLFPSLTRGANKGTLTENFTKAFGYYRRTNDVYWHGLDFHALRTTFHHRLVDGSCPGAHRRKLMGHEPLDEGERAYAQKGISIASLFDQVKKIPFDPERVQSPIPGFPERPQEVQGLRLAHGSKS